MEISSESGNAPNECLNCKHPIVEPGYSTALCAECRANFVKTPIPKWVLGFAVLILFTMIMGSIHTVGYIQAAVHLERAKSFMAENRFISSERELNLVLERFPDLTEAKVLLIISDYANAKFQECAEVANTVGGRYFEDQAMVDKVNGLTDRLNNMVPDTTILNALNALPADSIPKKIQLLSDFVKENDQDDAAAYLLADQLYENKEFVQCDSVLGRLLERDRYSSLSMLSLLAASKREQQEYDESIKVYKQLLDHNVEYIPALSGIARVQLRQGKTNDAKEYVELANSVDPHDIYSLEASILYQQAAGNTAESKKLLTELKSINSEESNGVYDRVVKILKKLTL